MKCSDSFPQLPQPAFPHPLPISRSSDISYLNIVNLSTCFFLYKFFFSYNTNKYINSAKPTNGHDRGEPQVLLRYDMLELQETGRGVEMQGAEAAERNQSVSLCRVKTRPQLMCCALI